jgi:hypothetical protein
LAGFAENSSSFFAALSFLPPGFSFFSPGLFRHWFLLIPETNEAVPQTMQVPENIALTTRRLIAKGYDILGMVPGMNLERSAHEKTCSLSGSAPEGASPV